MKEQKETLFVALARLEREGTLRQFIEAGLVSTKLILYYEVALEYDKQLKTTKSKPRQIITDVGEKFRISEPSVYRILKLLMYENRGTNSNTRRPSGVSGVCT